MTISRRDFGRRSLLAVLFASVFSSVSFLAGCPQTVEEVLAAIEKWVPTVINAATTILNLLAPFIPQVGAAAAIITTITGIVNSIIGAIQEYNAADPTTKTTLLGKIRDWLQAISDNLTGFVSSLNLSSNPIVKIVGTLLSVLVSAITGYINLLPVMQGAAPARTVAASVTVGGQRFQAKPKALDRTAFLNAWNADAKQLGHPEACIYEPGVQATEQKLKAARQAH